MTRLILTTAALLAALAAPAMAQTSWNSQQIGPFTYYDGRDRQGGHWHGESQQLGPFTDTTCR